MTPNSAASSHSAAACGRIERSVFTDWADSRVASTGLPCVCCRVPAAPRASPGCRGGTAALPGRNRPAPGAGGRRRGCPRRYRCRSTAAAGTRSAPRRSRRHGTRTAPPAGRGQHQPQRVAGPQVEPLGQGERDVDLAGPGGIGEAAGKNLPFPEAAGDRVTGRCDELDDARGHVERLDHGGVRGLGNPHHRSRARAGRRSGCMARRRPEHRAPCSSRGNGRTRSRSAAPPPQPSPPRQRRRRRSARGTARPASGAGTPPAGTARSRSSDDTAGPGHPQAGPQGEPHCTHMPIPAARGRTVNDAGIPTAVVLPRRTGRCLLMSGTATGATMPAGGQVAVLCMPASCPADGPVLAAGVGDDLAGDKAGGVGGEEGDQACGVGWFPDPAERERGPSAARWSACSRAKGPVAALPGRPR